MKNIGLIFAISSMSLACVNGSGNQDYWRSRDWNDRQHEENALIVTEDKTLEPFKRIEAKGFGKLRYHRSADYRVHITADSTVLDSLILESQNNTLILHATHEERNNTTRKLVVDIYCPFLEAVRLSGAVSLELVDSLKTESFAITLSGAGSLRGDLECENVEALLSGAGSADLGGTIRNLEAVLSGAGSLHAALDGERVNSVLSGAGKIILSGSVHTLKALLSGSGSYEADALKTQDAFINISGSGIMNCWVEHTLEADISGVGRLRYRGDPALNLYKTGLGTVIKN